MIIPCRASDVGLRTSDVRRRTSGAGQKSFFRRNVFRRSATLVAVSIDKEKIRPTLAFKLYAEGRRLTPNTRRLTSDARGPTPDVWRPTPAPALGHNDAAAGFFRGGDSGGILGKLGQQEVGKGA